MINNNRVYFAIEELAIGPYCSASGTFVHGVQSVGLTTTFNLEQAFELGQLSIYEQTETLPAVEMSITKDLDGYPLAYHLATTQATDATLLNRSNQRCDVFFAIFSDNQTMASGLPGVMVYCSGLYVNSLDYRLPVQGPAQEVLGLVGNDKLWIQNSGSIWYGGHVGFPFNGHVNSLDTPLSGIQRRWNVNMGGPSPTASVWPTNLPGISGVTGSGYNQQANGVFGCHIQDVDISTSLNREDLFELGRRRPYYKYARFPTPVNCTINMTNGGNAPGDMINADSDSLTNTSDQPIVIKLADGTVFNLGTKNRLSSVSYGGGSTDGSVLTMSFQYQTFNDLTITQFNDPSHLS